MCTEIGISPVSLKYWDPLLLKIKNRLRDWNSDHLSIAGRLVLLKASIDSLPSFWFNLFRIPATVLKGIEQTRRRFLWGQTSQATNKMHLLNWKAVCQPKSVGGLGLVPLKVKNKALLAKWWWRAYLERNSLWNKVFSQRYGPKWQYNLNEVVCGEGG